MTLSLNVRIPERAKVVRTQTSTGLDVTLYGYNRNGSPSWSSVYVQFIDPETGKRFVDSKCPDEYRTSRDGQHRGIRVTTRPGKGLFLTIPEAAFDEAVKDAEDMRIRQVPRTIARFYVYLFALALELGVIE